MLIDSKQTFDQVSAKKIKWLYLMTELPWYIAWYRVIHKKLSHKTKDKMQEKMKMIFQVDENLAHI